MVSETGTFPRPWQPDERQQRILDVLQREGDELEAAAAVAARIPFEDVEAASATIRAYMAGVRRATLLARREMHRLYGPQGIA